MAVPLLFFCLAAVAVVSAAGMLLSRNPVTSALWLILNLLCVAGLYLTLNAMFIAAVQVLIYAGAIMVLFLFVIMLLNLEARPGIRDISVGRAVAYVLAIIVLAQVAYVLSSTVDLSFDSATLEEAAATGAASFLATELFTRYALLLEMIGVLLLAATIGAVILARRATPEPR